jgi:hypothetical protein
MARTNVDRANDTCRSILAEIQSWVAGFAHSGAWTFERILKWRKEHVHGHPRWKKLQRWAHERCNTAFEIALANHDRKLIWTHVLDGKRVLSHAKSCDDRHCDIHTQSVDDPDNNFSAYCYAVLLPDRRIVLIPYREEYRGKELANGRLKLADIQAATHPTAKMLSVMHLPNGTPVLSSVYQLVVDMTDNGYIYLGPKFP